MNTTPIPIYIAYLRVSTKKQGDSGLGLEAQKEAILKYVEQNKGILMEIITDVESAANKERISAFSTLSLEKLLRRRRGLMNAIKLAQQHNATILVKEVSRLTRYSVLMDYLINTVKFIAVDSPYDDIDTIRDQTRFNEREVKKISVRTKAALDVLKKRRKLGNPNNFNNEGRRLGNKTALEEAYANENNNKVIDMIYLFREKNRLPYREIADLLNARGFVTATGKAFKAMTVWLLYYRRRSTLKEVERVATIIAENQAKVKQHK